MILDELKQYALDCISGKIISGRKHIWACKRLLKDIDRIGQLDFPYVWNERQAENIVEWFALLRHSKGVLAKQPIILTPWQRFRICQLYGWVHKETGYRRFKKYFTERMRNLRKRQVLHSMRQQLHQPRTEKYTRFIPPAQNAISPKLYSGKPD